MQPKPVPSLLNAGATLPPLAFAEHVRLRLPKMKADKQHAKKRARKLFASVLFRQTAEQPNSLGRRRLQGRHKRHALANRRSDSLEVRADAP